MRSAEELHSSHASADLGSLPSPCHQLIGCMQATRHEFLREHVTSSRSRVNCQQRAGWNPRRATSTPWSVQICRITCGKGAISRAGDWKEKEIMRHEPPSLSLFPPILVDWQAGCPPPSRPSICIHGCMTSHFLFGAAIPPMIDPLGSCVLRTTTVVHPLIEDVFIALATKQRYYPRHWT